MTETSKKNKNPSHLLEAIELSLVEVLRYNIGSEEKPAAVLWADMDKQWEPTVQKLRLSLKNLLTLGEYDVSKRTGPAIWLKCVVDRSIDIGIPKDSVPIIYMPGVSRQTLRAAGECPFQLQPLIELQYRGIVWTQRNGKDWTVEAYLTSKEGLDLDIGGDDATRRSMHASLSVLSETPLGRLKGRQLESEDFDRLMVGDHYRDMLEWMCDPGITRSNWGENRWHAFRSRCRDDFKFDPETDGQIAAAERMGLHKEDVWKQLWARFTEAPALYPEIENLLRKAKPAGMLLFNPEPWPDENEKAETNLRIALLEFSGLAVDALQSRIEVLEKEHGQRREWVWAKTGKCPLAKALGHLVILSNKSSVPMRGSSFDEIAKSYSSIGYEVDAVLLKALAEGRSAQDKSAIQIAARALYFHWLSDAAEHFQKLIETKSLPSIKENKDPQIDNGVCMMFVDGLRYDLGIRLCALLEARGLKNTIECRWAGAPTVTATGKPAASPVASKIGLAPNLNDSFAPVDPGTGQELNTVKLRNILVENGYQILKEESTVDVKGKGWIEFGSIDKLGHDLGLDLARQIEEQLEAVVDKIVCLAEDGWKSILVVSDHGWLLMPGGLPKTELPGYLVESRWSRCAAIKGHSQVSVPKVGWFWNPYLDVAVAPGISTFKANEVYAHGGLSVQECLVPYITIHPAQENRRITVSIASVQWAGLRCRIKISPPNTDIKIDIRAKINAPETTLVEATKAIDDAGQVSLVVPDEDKIGTAVNVVVVDPAGNVLAKQTTTIGGD